MWIHHRKTALGRGVGACIISRKRAKQNGSPKHAYQVDGYRPDIDRFQKNWPTEWAMAGSARPIILTPEKSTYWTTPHESSSSSQKKSKCLPFYMIASNYRTTVAVSLLFGAARPGDIRATLVVVRPKLNWLSVWLGISRKEYLLTGNWDLNSMYGFNKYTSAALQQVT